MCKQHQRGAVAPLIALLLFVIVICVALVVDLGRVHSVKAELQRAVDAAALAGARYVPRATDVTAAATAAAGGNQVDGDKFANLLSQPTTTLDIVLGKWDETALGQDAADRFTAGATDADAVYVKASYNVEHTFFFFTDSTTVIADAIALAKPIYPILPLAVVSCIPTADETHPPGTLPDMTICGVVGHEFGSDPLDLAAWSSLTIGPASAENILDIMGSAGNFELFNQIVFGRGLDYTNGIENDPLTTSRPGHFSFDPDAVYGCVNDGININCGLGQINGKDVAPPDDFTPPPSVPPLNTATLYNTTVYSGNLSFDPLSDYNKELPRWYNISDNTTFDDDDHFIRVVTQDGILLQRPGEPDAVYAQRLEDLNNGTLKPYGDDRFMKYVDIHNDPDFLAVARDAGYPKVHVMNGVTGPVLEAFLKQVFDTEDKKDIKDPLPCSENDPFPEGERSIRVNVPVIFAGNCENWKAVDSSDFTYIGMAKFLLTRAELTNTMYACPAGEQGYAGGCSETFSPPLASGYFGLVSFNAPAMLEGLYTLPTTDDDDDLGSLVEVFLVE